MSDDKKIFKMFFILFCTLTQLLIEWRQSVNWNVQKIVWGLVECYLKSFDKDFIPYHECLSKGALQWENVYGNFKSFNSPFQQRHMSRRKRSVCGWNKVHETLIQMLTFILRYFLLKFSHLKFYETTML